MCLYIDPSKVDRININIKVDRIQNMKRIRISHRHTDMCLYRDPSRVDRIESISISIKVDRIQNMKNNRI